MRSVEPETFLISRPSLEWDGINAYLASVDDAQPDYDPTKATASDWLTRQLSPSDAEVLVEFAGRLCYRSWAPGLNANVTRTRTDSDAYLRNIIDVGHGSVLEHAQFTFVLHNVSRVFTHELVRHRVGVGISQESLRFVRLTDIAFWWPQWAKDDPQIMARTEGLVESMEELQDWFGVHFGLDEPDVPFSQKKAKTSFMRRFAPEGLATGLVWSANVRTLRWVIEARTTAGAEEEIRQVFHLIALTMTRELPSLFSDFSQVSVEGSDIPAWIPANRKV